MFPWILTATVDIVWTKYREMLQESGMFPVGFEHLAGGYRERGVELLAAAGWKPRDSFL